MSIKNKKNLDIKYGKMTISRFLRAYRMTEGLTQSEFADQLGWSKSNVCDIESGRRNLGFDRAIILSKKLGFPISYILETIFNQQLQNAGLEYSVKLTEENIKKAA